MKSQSDIELHFKSLLSQSEQDEVFSMSQNAIYPFNYFTILIAYILEKRKISLNDLSAIMNHHKVSNPNMSAFEYSSPRLFGENYAQEFLKEKFKTILDPKEHSQYKTVDSSYVGEYDLYMMSKVNNQDHLIKLESKASRGIDKNKKSGSYADRAMFSTDTVGTYDMNFQQLKPNCCDVFVFIGVWLDQYRYWILSADEVKNHPSFSNQHRASEKGENGEVMEGQLHIKPSNINQFSQYEVLEADFESKIIEKFKKQRNIP